LVAGTTSPSETDTVHDPDALTSLDDNDLPPTRGLARWLAGRGVDYADRQRVSEHLFLQHDRRRITRFALLLGLSVTIATVGLLQDSTAVVIGAMLLAPLMTPVLGLAAALTMNWPRRMASSGALVVAGAAGSIALAWLLTEFAPLNTVALSDEILARTRPSTGDLLVALAAGAAGGFALIREDVSEALPGVAIAVALVPPLGAVGITLGTGEPDLAFEALLLFTTNVVAIVLAASLVFLVGGFVPHSHLTRSRRRILGYLGLVAVMVALVAAPLRVTVDRLVSEAQLNAAIDQDIVDWLGPDTDLEVTSVVLADEVITLDVGGPTPPPPALQLATRLRPDVGPGLAVEVRWIEEQVDRSATSVAAVRP
jgi:uncharacterized hydrophobic protein (TIGR00271 family)